MSKREKERKHIRSNVLCHPVSHLRSIALTLESLYVYVCEWQVLKYVSNGAITYNFLQHSSTIYSSLYKIYDAIREHVYMYVCARCVHVGGHWNLRLFNSTTKQERTAKTQHLRSKHQNYICIGFPQKQTKQFYHHQHLQ